jgi:hypothetical protein
MANGSPASELTKVPVTVTDLIVGGDVFSVLKLPGERWEKPEACRMGETVKPLLRDRNLKGIGIDLSDVRFLPSGFFAKLFNWRERGKNVLLTNPHSSVQQMWWFKACFSESSYQPGNFLFDLDRYANWDPDLIGSSSVVDTDGGSDGDVPVRCGVDGSTDGICDDDF